MIDKKCMFDKDRVCNNECVGWYDYKGKAHSKCMVLESLQTIAEALDRSA